MFREPQIADSAGAAGSEPLAPGHLLTLVYSERPIGKVFRRNLLDGSVEKQVQSELSEGRLKCSAVWSLAELERLINRLGPQHALIYGVPVRAATVGASVPVVSVERASGRPEAVTRTADQFAWPERGVLMLDIDPPKDGPPLLAQEAIDAVRALHPAFATADALWAPSASSGVDGAGVKGQRLYFLIKDARLIEDARQVIKDLQWVKGHGRYELTKPGTLIERWLIDAVTWKPEWLDFAGEPTLEDGIQRERIPAFIDRATARTIDLSALLALDTEALHQEAEALRQAARAALHQVAIEKRSQYLEQHPERSAYLGADPYKDRGELSAEHVLFTTDGQAVTVRELLADRRRWHGAPFCDPIEPDYRGGQPVAKAFLLGGAQTVSSFAHGQKNYRLLPDLSELFAGPEGAEQESAPQEPSAPEPTWRAKEKAHRRQAIQNLRAPAITGTVVETVAKALRDRNACRIASPMASGKTREMCRLVIEYLQRNDPGELLVVSTTSHALMSEITGAVLELIDKGQLAQEDADRMAVVAQEEPLRPFIHPKTGERPYRVVVCTHAALLPRGDDINSAGRVLRKLINAEDQLQINGGSPLKVWAIIDEADAYLARLQISLLLGLRLLDGADPITGQDTHRPITRCPRSCPTCHNLMEYQTHLRGATISAIPMTKIAPCWPALPGIKDVDVSFLKEALLEPESINGYAIHGIDASKLPSADQYPAFEMVNSRHGGGMRINPLGDGIIRELAAQPGATIRIGLPRDPDSGEFVDPASVTEGMSVTHPHASCSPRLVSWNPRPLAELRSVTDRLTLMTATLTTTANAMVEEAIGENRCVTVQPRETRRLKGVLVLGVTRWALERTTMEELVKIAPVLLMHARKADAERHADRLASWRNGSLLPATWGRRGAQADVSGKANLLSAYTRSSIARGANLPFYRITIVWTDCYASTRDTFGLGHESVYASIEEGRRAPAIQSAGRGLRRAKEGEDNGYRVVVAVVPEDPETGQPSESLDWFIDGLRETTEHIELRMLTAFPKRAIEACRDWLSKGESTVDDRPAGQTASMSSRQRKLTAEERQAEKEVKRAARKAEKLAKAREMAAAGERWVVARDSLNLRKFFDKTELETIKSQFIQ